MFFLMLVRKFHKKTVFLMAGTEKLWLLQKSGFQKPAKYTSGAKARLLFLILLATAISILLWKLEIFLVLLLKRLALCFPSFW